jgi:hypothetical protein
MFEILAVLQGKLEGDPLDNLSVYMNVCSKIIPRTLQPHHI